MQCWLEQFDLSYSQNHKQIDYIDPKHVDLKQGRVHQCIWLNLQQLNATIYFSNKINNYLNWILSE